MPFNIKEDFFTKAALTFKRYSDDALTSENGVNSLFKASYAAEISPSFSQLSKNTFSSSIALCGIPDIPPKPIFTD